MNWSGIFLLFATSLCFAASHCPHTRLRHTAIGGHTIQGNVLRHHKPLKFAQVQLYFSSGKNRMGRDNGRKGLVHHRSRAPGHYRLVVRGWGSTTVQLNPELDKGFGAQTPTWDISLIDNACVGTGFTLNSSGYCRNIAIS
jgi:hypothetical protein